MKKVMITKVSDLKGYQPNFHQKILVREPVNSKMGSRFLLFRTSRINPGGRDEYHAHPNSEQIIYVLRGKGKMLINKKTYYVSKDMLVFIPPGVWHHIENDSKAPLHFIIVWAPPPRRVDWVPRKNKKVG